MNVSFADQVESLCKMHSEQVALIRLLSNDLARVEACVADTAGALAKLEGRIDDLAVKVEILEQ